MQNGGGGRFKTIREEPDAPEDCSSSSSSSIKPVATKNNSFLQSYLANEMTRNINGSPGNGNKQMTATQVPVHNRFVASKSSPVAEVASKFAVKSPQENASKLTFGQVKGPQHSPAVSVHPPKPIGAKPMLPPPLPDSTPPRYSVKSSTVLNSNTSSSPVTTAENKWKNKYDETEAKRKTLLIQSQKRESSR